MLPRASSADTASGLERAAAAGAATVDMERRIAERQAEVSTMLQEREALEVSKAAIRAKVKKRLAKVEASNSVQEVRGALLPACKSGSRGPRRGS